MAVGRDAVLPLPPEALGPEADGRADESHSVGLTDTAMDGHVASNRYAPSDAEARAGSPAARPLRQRNRSRGGMQMTAPVVPPVFSEAISGPPAEDSEPGFEAEPMVGMSAAQRASCTMAQMRRFIKSRPYVPIHELRRRFEIEGFEDDVNPVPTDKGTIYVGLPAQEARFLGDLIKAGEVGCELLLDPCSPAVIGVYAMRPVARQ